MRKLFPLFKFVYSLVESISVANPKSPIISLPFELIRRFSGFISLCTIPIACRYSRPIF